MLLDAAEELIGIQFVFAGSGAAQQAHVQNNHIAAARLEAIENVAKMIEIEVVAHGHKDVARPRANCFRCQLGLQLQVELVHLHVRRAASVGAALGNRENDKEQNGKGSARHGGHRLGEKIDNSDEKQRQRDQAESYRNLHTPNIEIKWHLEFAHPRPGVSKHEHRQAVHREAPDDAEGVEVCKKSDIAAADKNGDNLQQDDDIDDAVASAESGVRLPEPGAENAVLGNAV